MRKLAFFPGKFQPPHIGHVLTISKILKKYDVIIGISPDIPRVISQKEVKKLFDVIFGNKVQYFLFDDVLTQYTILSDFPNFDVLLSGNDEIVKWAKQLNLFVKKISRSSCIGGSGTELRGLYKDE